MVQPILGVGSPSARSTVTTIRPGPGLYGYERALARAGFSRVAGADEAGRGACAGPLVAAAVILSDRRSRQIEGLKDSKLLTPRARERIHDQILSRAEAVAWVAVEPEECDRLGMHVADLQALRRAMVRLDPAPDFVLTDGFGVDGLGLPGLAVWKGDRVAACVAAASVIAKVTRDRMMTELHDRFPQYGFDIHKGYVTRSHQQALDQHGPCPAHRMRFDNVARTVACEQTGSGTDRVAAR